MYFSNGNIKLNKKVLVWNLPRLKTCPGAYACKDWCYEIKAEKRFKNAIIAREKNLQESKKENFVKKAVEYMNKKKFDHVRVHASGDFYSQQYLEKWYAIARHLPSKNFYAFTKSLHLNLYEFKPKNFNIIQSFGGRYDHLIDLKRSYNKILRKGEKPLAWEFFCSSDKLRNGTCGGSCTICQTHSPLWMVSHLHK